MAPLLGQSASLYTSFPQMLCNLRTLSEGIVSTISGPPRPRSQAKGDLFATEGQRAGEGNKGERKGNLLGDREETDLAHRQMVVYKDKTGNPVLG